MGSPYEPVPSRDSQPAGQPRPIAEWSQEVLALTRRWLLMLRRERLELAFTLAQPILWLVLFGASVGGIVDTERLGTSNYLGFIVPGMIAFTVVTNSVNSAAPLLFDKFDGYLDKLMSMPIRRNTLIVSRFLFQFGLNSVQVVLILLLARLAGAHIATGILGVLVILLCAGLLSLAVTSAFVAVAYRVSGQGAYFAITGFLTLPLTFLSSAFVPRDAMPAGLSLIATLNPLTYAIETIRGLMLEGWAAGLAVNLGILTLAAIVLMAVGTYQFNKQAR